MSQNLQPTIGVLLPAVERFDGTGGAIALWVKETYQGVKQPHLVLCPSNPSTDGRLERHFRSKLYDIFDSSVGGAARLLAKVSGKTSARLYAWLLAGDRVWLWRSYPALASLSVVHVHNRPRYVKSLRRMGYRGRILLHMHNSLSSYVTPEEFAAFRDQIDEIVFCSEFLRQEALSEFGSLPKSGVLHNGVSAPRTEDDPPRRTSGSLVFAGRLVQEKGAAEAIEICTALNALGKPTRLTILGGTGSGISNDSTSYSRALVEAARVTNDRFGASTVVIRGPVPHRAVLEEFARSDVFLYPCSWQEPFGMVALEAMSAGAIPVVSDRGGLAEVLGPTGYLITWPKNEPTGNTDTFVKAIIEILALTEPDRAELREQVRKRAAASFSWPSISAMTDSVLLSHLETITPAKDINA